jgi:hypothetical protein
LWSGLLVEPIPHQYDKMLALGRRVWTANTCLSTTTSPQTINFDLGDDMASGLAQNNTNQPVRMQCLPLYTLLLAIGNPTVDFLSLDIEGPEYEVLLTVPWDKVDIRAIAVETQFHDTDTKEKLFGLMQAAGFTHLSSLSRDDLFVKLPAGGSSPRLSPGEVLASRRPRACHYNMVPRPELARHCALRWPRDYFGPRTPPVLATAGHCPWTLQSIARTHGPRWREALSLEYAVLTTDSSESALVPCRSVQGKVPNPASGDRSRKVIGK